MRGTGCTAFASHGPRRIVFGLPLCDGLFVHLLKQFHVEAVSVRITLGTPTAVNENDKPQLLKIPQGVLNGSLAEACMSADGLHGREHFCPVVPGMVRERRGDRFLGRLCKLNAVDLAPHTYAHSCLALIARSRWP
jgi:hypothetical protein